MKPFSHIFHYKLLKIIINNDITIKLAILNIYKNKQFQ